LTKLLQKISGLLFLAHPVYCCKTDAVLSEVHDQ